MPFEFFDSFTAAHDDLRALTLQGMVTYWEEIQRGPAMLAVWNSLTNGEMPWARERMYLLYNALSYPPRYS